ncbi:substrate-binding and VWA domain-containing protein [Mameliella alba]|nr:substrate-binding and VWA domain-containing protein [Antarctobacter heliothermus]MBY6142510.1 substrate-binding and VWA domain-containing protein [Mameliella alba]MCA0953765.1 substrate-binding and VWA domain-containing protein [Mameliella alba]
MRTLLAIFAALVAILIGLLVINSGAFAPRVALHIVSGSENRALEPLIMEWAADNKADIQITYLGSVDISRELTKGTETEFDAVWPANSLWIELGDTQKVVKHDASVLRSPVVLGLRMSVARQLGWIGRSDVTIQEIHKAAQDGSFRLSMTSATQSNSGASAYFGFLYALAGNPDVLTMAHLQDPETLDNVRDLLAQVDRSSGSSGWLVDALVDNYDSFDAMFNYEALVIEANQKLVAEGKEPLYAIYPANGLSVADSPLGYVSKGDDAKEAKFLDLQEFLNSKTAQDLLTGLGRRAGLIGLDASGADTSVWNPEWGIELTRAIAPIPTPSSEVIGEALRLYQTELRKPSLTVWVLDVSGSMGGQPIEELKDAMRLLLDPDASAVNLLQPSSRDVTIILPFNHNILEPIVVEGNNAAAAERALNFVNALQADGGTDVYYAIYEAFEAMRPYAEDGTLPKFLPAIVAMTDGASDTENRSALLAHMDMITYTKDIPIHAIAFGSADEAQLDELSKISIGRLFHAGEDLAKALRSAKGYN